MNKVLLLLSPLAFSASLFAQAAGTDPAAGAASVRNHRPLSPILSALDIDGNGTISATEIANAPVTLAALDLDGDGSVAAAELASNRPVSARQARAGDFRYRPSSDFNVVLNLDANNDGSIQQLEIANAMLSLKRMDANNDGVITRDELRPAVLLAQHRAP